MNIRLSICIPTYNFGAFIGQTLESIVPQLNSEVELVILDSNSTDGTGPICQRFAEKNPSLKIRYIKSQERGGIDRDIALVTSMAEGEYVWLFSADDIMMPVAIRRVLSHLQNGFDIYLSEHIICDFNMSKITKHPIFNNIEPGFEFDLSVPSSKQLYFSSARTSEAFFSFLSTPIFRKEIWDRVKDFPDEFYDTCWALGGRLLLSAEQGLRIKYLGQQLLLKRGENDSFADLGRVHRMGIAIEGYGVIMDKIFGKNSSEAFHIRRVLRFELPIKTVMVTKLRAYQQPKKEDLQVLNRLIDRHYMDRGMSNFINKLIYKFSNKLLLEVLYFLVKTSKLLFKFPKKSSV